MPKVISEGVLKERVQVICPACGQQVEAVASDGRIKGYCAVAKQYVFVMKYCQTPEFRVKISSAMKKKWQDPEYRAKQITTHTGKSFTPETRAKISAATTRQHNRRRYDSERQNSGMP